MTVPRLSMVLGDPAGIDPEIASRLLAEAASREKAAVVLVADRTEYGPAASPTTWRCATWRR